MGLLHLEPVHCSNRVSCSVLCLVAQSCPTLCNPMDCSPSGSSVHGDSPGKNTGVGCHFHAHGDLTSLAPHERLPEILVVPRDKPHGRCSSRKPLRRPQPRELRAFFSCMAWRAIPGPFSKRKRRLDSLEAAQGSPRDPRRDSRGERSTWLPFETRPDSPGEPGMQPRDPCLPWRGILGPGHTPR